MTVTLKTNAPVGNWTRAIALNELQQKSKAVVKLSGKQILLIYRNGKIHACNNRCPHEGFPLSEGTLSDTCTLTCNWHSWRFNLEDGEAVVGGDAVRLYPHEIRGNDIWLDISDPPPHVVRTKAMAGLREAFDEHDYERIARELARFERAGGEPRAALVEALRWAMPGLEFGTTHAHAAAPDWLSLKSNIDTESRVENLIPWVEIIGHLSWDVLMQKGPFPFSANPAKLYDAKDLSEAIESENEPLAISLALKGLDEGGSQLLRPVLEAASLNHYQNFGHSVIFCDKTFELLGLLGEEAADALLLPLVRSLCTTAREDLIPEFKAYAPAIASWNGNGDEVPTAQVFQDKGVSAALDLIDKSSAHPEALYHCLMQAAADAMLHYDARYRAHFDKPVQQNIDWLDFTHALTHLNAARKVCEKQPELWANAFLQTGCFLGRNAKFVDWQQDTSQWKGRDETLIDEVLVSMLDHGEPLYIFPAHTLKLATALKQELALNPDAPWRETALAALNRYAHEPVKRKHMRRVVTQAAKFVELEG